MNGSVPHVISSSPWNKARVGANSPFKARGMFCPYHELDLWDRWIGSARAGDQLLNVKQITIFHRTNAGQLVTKDTSFAPWHIMGVAVSHRKQACWWGERKEGRKTTENKKREKERQTKGTNDKRRTRARKTER